MKYQAMLFDMDGVLVDTEPLGKDMMFEAAHMQGLPLTEDQWRQLIGSTMQATQERLLKWFPGKADPARYTVDWCELMKAHARTHGMPKKPGADAVLRELRAQGIRLGLCTSNAEDIVSCYLEAAGWLDAFDEVITGGMVTHSKPDPEIYLFGAKKLHCDPAACIGVEDSFNGIRAVRAAGMTSIMVPDLLPFSEALSPYVDVCLESLEQLVPWMNKHE